MGAHRRVDMSHDGIDGDGIAGRIRRGAENVAERIKPESLAIDAKTIEQLLKLHLHGVDRNGGLAVMLANADPTGSILRDESDTGVGLVLRLGSSGNRLADRGDGLRPEWAAGRDC